MTITMNEVERIEDVGMERTITHTDFCCECGVDVSPGSGHFVNRVPDFNQPEDRHEMGRQFPYGDYVCASCDVAGV